MESRNLTLSLPVALIRKAKIYAAERDTTINAVVRELLEQTVSAETRSRAAVDLFLSLAGEGRLSDADPRAIRREELHERR